MQRPYSDNLNSLGVLSGARPPRRGAIELSLPPPRLAMPVPSPMVSTPMPPAKGPADIAADARAWVAQKAAEGRPGFQLHAEPPLPAAPPEAPAMNPIEVADQALMKAFGVEFVDGRYRCHGYAFTALGQAMNYSRRLRGPMDAAVPIPRSAPTPAPPLQAVSPAAPPRWRATDETVEIAGVQITGGLFYLGKARPGDAWSQEKCLIDPALPVATSGADPAGTTLSYWPAYRELSSGARRSYIDWLAGGRSAPEAGIGYVFIFFYGLERRLFVDQAFDEIDAILDEVRRLLATYGENHSFRAYATSLMEAAELVRETEIARPPCSPESRYLNYEMSLSVRRYLGALLTAQTAFDADDALLWLMSLPDTYLRTPGTRCFDEMSALWRIRFTQRHPTGLKIRAPKTRLSGAYRAASGLFEVTISLGDLPDIAAVSAPLSGLRDLLTGCMDDLDPYSRLLGRKPEARGELEGALCLPAELRDTTFAAGVNDVRRAIDGLIGEERIAPTSVRKLCEMVGLDVDEPKMSAAAQRQVAMILDRLDFAFEPDRRYGEGSLSPSGEMVIYRAADGAPVDRERLQYVTARTLVEIAALAATADGEVAPAEFESISADIQSIEDLAADERTRLLAYALWLLRDPPRQQAALTRLAKLPLKQRQTITQSAISAVLADGQVQPAEVRFLEKLYKSLGLPQDQVYAALHRGSVQPDEPVVISPEAWTSGVAIPPERVAPPQGVAIDEARLARVRLETSQVSSLLAGIFAEEEVHSPAPIAAQPFGDAERFFGLDARHADLLAMVLAGGHLDRSAFDQQARSLRLLPDGALETINEWGFETFDEPVIEGDEVLVAVEHLRDQLHTMENGR